MPTTFATFVIGTLALAGIFPLAGFWSKDEILLGAMEDGYPFILVLGLIGAFMTACYMGRCVFLTFFGEYRGHGHPHESPRSMTVPLILLAIPSVASASINAPAASRSSATGWPSRSLACSDFHLEHHEFNPVLAAVSLGVALAGSWSPRRWSSTGRTPPATGAIERVSALRALKTLLIEKYYLDKLFVDGVVGFIKGPLAQATYWTNQKIIDGVVNAVGVGTKLPAASPTTSSTRRASTASSTESAYRASETGGVLRLVQTGRVQQYALLLFATVGLLGLMLILFT